MPNFAANLSMMYTEVAFLDRFERAAADGFRGVEFLFPYEFQASEIRSRLQTHGLEQVLFNTVPGDFAGGERGLASLAGREREFLDGVDRAIEYALELKCPRLHAMAGLAQHGARREIYLANLAEAARRCAAQRIDLLIEPINTRDIPGYFLNRQADAHQIVAELGAANLKVQMDLYHCQIVEGDLAMRIREYLPGVGHFQIAGVPERHEPDLGELNYPYLFSLLDSLGYAGWIGCEYRPRGETSAGLGWLQPWLKP